MPGGDGLVLARTIQQRHPTVTVIMVTANADFSSLTDARRAGAVDYLTKPVLPADLVASVSRAAATRERRNPVTATPARVEPPTVAASSGNLSDPPIDRLFRAMCAMGASDLHLSASVPPMVRKDGEMMPLDASAAPLDVEDVVELLNPIVPGK